MKPLHWTKADAKGAEKMGFRIGTDMFYGEAFCWIKLDGARFKSDDEAIQFVFETSDSCYGGPACADVKTCRKAVLLCMGAKRGDL